MKNYMSEVLSQNQIDMLLSGILSGDLGLRELEEKIHEKKIRPYDFNIPKKINKEQVKTLSIIHENYGRILSSYLSGVLRTYCQVELLTIEEQRYFEYSNALPENNMTGILEMPPLQGSSMITVNQSLTFTIIDRLLGGQGEAYEEDREYTEIEVILMQRIIRECCILLKDAWANVHEISPIFLRLEANSRQTQLVSPNETVVIIVLNVKIKDVEGNMSFCMPYLILEPVLEHLNTRYWFTASTSEVGEKKHYKDLLFNRVNTVLMELKAILGTSHISLREIMDLRVGDVIQLDQRTADKTIIKSNNTEWFCGTMGQYKNHFAIKIDEILMEGINEYGTKLNSKNNII
jgi:flagellar motor switch protein FliM